MIPDTERQMQVVFDAHQYDLSEAEKDGMLADLDSLGKQVAHFPIHDLHVLVQGYARTNDVSAKLSLILPGQTLVAHDHDAVPAPAFERAVAALSENVKAYKDRLGNVTERQHAEKGTGQPLQPSADLDLSALDAAVEAGDEAAFRAATLPYEGSVRLRAGRWVQRYPEFEARFGDGMTIGDVVEEVFLMAFEGYPTRPEGVRFGDWLDGLIDPAVKALMAHPDEELENVRLAQSARLVEPGPGGA